MQLSNFKIKEADVQCEIVASLRSMDDVDVRVEATWPSRHHRSGNMRVDILVFYRGMALCMIEVKKPGKKPLGRNTRQRKAYEDSGVPVFFCIGRDGIPDTFASVACALEGRTT